MKTLPYICSVLFLVGVLAFSHSAVAQSDSELLDMLEMDADSADLADEIAARNAALAQKDKAITELKIALEDITSTLENKIAEFEASKLKDNTSGKIKELKETIKARDEAVLETGELISALEEKLAETQDALDSVKNAVAAKDAEIEKLKEADKSKKAQDKAILEAGERIQVLEEKLAEKQQFLDLAQNAIAVKNTEIENLKGALDMTAESTRKERLILAYNTGCIYKAGRQYDKAESEFLKALELDPDDPGVHYNLGILYDDSLGDAKKAKYHYKRFLALSPNDKDAPNVVEWMNALK